MTTDLELARKCAERMWLTLHPQWNDADYNKGAKGIVTTRGLLYNPITDDAQNAALDDVILKHGQYEINPKAFIFWDDNGYAGHSFTHMADMTVAENRRRARCLCVAGLK